MYISLILMGTSHITTTISTEFKELLEQHHIKRSEALRVGCALLLAERGVKEYDNNLLLMRKLNATRQLLEQKSQELEDLKNGKT